MAVRRYLEGCRRSRVSPWKNPCSAIPTECRQSARCAKRHGCAGSREGWMRLLLLCCASRPSRPSHHVVRVDLGHMTPRWLQRWMPASTDSRGEGLPPFRTPCAQHRYNRRTGSYCMRASCRHGERACLRVWVRPPTAPQHHAGRHGEQKDGSCPSTTGTAGCFYLSVIPQLLER